MCRTHRLINQGSGLNRLRKLTRYNALDTVRILFRHAQGTDPGDDTMVRQQAIHEEKKIVPLLSSTLWKRIYPTGFLTSC